MKTKTTSTTTTKQEQAAKAVRDYMRSKRLHIDTDEIVDGNISLMTSDRRSAGDDEPAPEIVKAAREHVKAMRALSPLVYVSTEAIDEWLHINVLVKRQPRKDRPEEVKDLTKIVLARLPDSIGKHPKVRFIGEEHMREFGGAITALTDVLGPYGKMSVLLGWRLAGDTTEGWRLVVQWGTHIITRPAKFKKLTPGIVLDQLDKILGRLSDPLDAMGWTIHVRKAGDYVMNLSGRVPEKFDMWMVTEEKTGLARANRGDLVEFNNRFTGQRVNVAVGQPIPDEVKPLRIDE